MLVGHHAVGFAAKRVAPSVSLGTLQLASVFLDLIVFVDQLAGIEHARVTPGITAFSALDGYDVAISHSLLTAVLWSAAFAVVYFWRRRDVRATVVLSGVVFSHWVLDWVSHDQKYRSHPVCIDTSDSACGILLLQRSSWKALLGARYSHLFESDNC